MHSFSIILKCAKTKTQLTISTSPSGADLQIIQRNIKTCRIRSVPRTTANTAEQRGMVKTNHFRL